MKKKIITSSILIIILLLKILPLNISYATDEESIYGELYGNMHYKIENNEAIITAAEYGYSSLFCKIPDEINGYKVTKIGPSAFRGMRLLDITIGKNVKEIGYAAFEGVSYLKDLTIPENVEIIDDYAFAEITTLETVNIEGNIKELGKYSFADCTELKTVNVTGSLNKIDRGAFRDCIQLHNINIPGAIQISDFSFQNCSSLSKIEIPDTVKDIGGNAFYNTEWLKQKRQENPLVVINNILIDAEKYPESEIMISEDIVKISSFAFSNSISLTKVTIPDTVDINDTEGIFSGCTYLKEINLPSNLKAIGNSMFIECKNLEHIELPKSITKIENFAFMNCTNLEKTDIPDTIEYIGERAFEGTKWLENKRIENALVIEKGILIDGKTCEGDIVIPNTVTSMSACAFSEAKDLISVKLPDTLSEISECAFLYCKNLKNIEIPNTIEKIDDLAFFNCQSLLQITIPESVNFIGEMAFSECVNLTKITFEGDVSYLEESIFEKNKDNLIIHVPNKKTNIYQYCIENEINVIVEQLYGDVNKDNKINARDAKLVLQAFVGEIILTEEQQVAADVNEDGKINARDAKLILQYYTGQINEF